MRIGIVSDTHLHSGEEAYELLWGHLHGVDLILHAGDVVALGVIEALGRIAPVEGVSGNMDPPEVRRLWPEKRVVHLGAFDIGLVHGSGPPQGLEHRVRREFSNVDAVVFGHSHQPLVLQHGAVLLVNPGSPTDRRFAPYCSIAMMDVEIALKAEIVRI